MNLPFLILICLWLSMAKAQDSTINFKQMSFQDALQIAATENKLIFLNAVTNWCGICKMMSREVFVQKKVCDYYNQNFINLQIDLEEQQNAHITQAYQIYGFPSFLFFNQKGELVYKLMGYLNPEELLIEGGNALIRAQITEAGEQINEKALKNLVNKMHASDKELLDLESYLLYYRSAKNWPAYSLKASDLIDNFFVKDVYQLYEIAYLITAHTNDQGLLKIAEKCAKKARKIKDNYPNCLVYAKILYKMGEFDKAKSIVQEAIKIADTNHLSHTDGDDLLKIINVK